MSELLGYLETFRALQREAKSLRTTLFAAEEGGLFEHWITLRNPGGGKGTHVKIDGEGEITAGPKPLKGRNIGDLGGKSSKDSLAGGGTGDTIKPAKESHASDETSRRGDDGPGRGQADAGTAGGSGAGGRPGLRVVRPEYLPTPPTVVGPDTYPAGSLDENQQLGTNLALNRFAKGGKGFLLGDGTGVGKTRQLLAIGDQFHRETGKPVLLVTQNKQIIAGSFKHDAAAMGVDTSAFEMGTYDDLRAGKVGKGQYGLVMFDEAHGLKNAESGKSTAALQIKADHKLFATATPMDRPTAAAYFMSEVTGEPLEKIEKQLGFTVKDHEDPETHEIKRVVSLAEGKNWAQVMDAIVEMRDKAIADGAMVRREYPFYGEIKEETFKLDGQDLRDQKSIDDYWQSEIAGARTPSYKRNLAGQRILELSRWLESRKVGAVFDTMMKEIESGRQVVIVAEGVNDTHIKGLEDDAQSMQIRSGNRLEKQRKGTYDPDEEEKPGRIVRGMIGQLAERLEKEGIPFAKIFGAGSKADAVEQFQSGQAWVALATPQSGGTGINLDDNVGNAPRTMLIATPNFSGDVFDQILGRVSRRNTKTPSRVKFMLAEGGLSDARRKQVVSKKIDTLRRIQGGEDLDRAAGLNLTAQEEAVSGNASGGKPKPARGIATDVKTGWHAQKQRPSYVAVLKKGVARPEYERIAARARKLGGYWSSFAKMGAVPGFQFPTMEQAEQFKRSITEGDFGCPFHFETIGNQDFAGEQLGFWITVGGAPEGDKKHAGGTPVHVTDGKIDKGPPALKGKPLGHLPDKKPEPVAATGDNRKAVGETQEGRDAMEERLTDPARENPVVDPSRQLGLYSRDDIGNAQEVGERPGQANLFGRDKYRLADAPVLVEPVSPQFDPKHTGEMFPVGPVTSSDEPKDKAPDALPESTEPPAVPPTPAIEAVHDPAIAPPAPPATKTPEAAAAKAKKAVESPHLDEFHKFNERLSLGDMTPEELKAHYRQTKENAAAIKAELGKKNKDELTNMISGFVRNGMTKADLVDRAYGTMLDQHHVGDSYSYGMGKGAAEKALDEAIEKTTAEQIKARAEAVQKSRAERKDRLDAIKKAITDPQTLDDFEKFVKYRKGGESALTPEQRVKYDELKAEHDRASRRASEAKSATVQQVGGAPEGLSIDLKETKHTKTGEPLHVAVLNQRVETDKYRELNAKAKALGGWYSSFRGAGAIPGFQFKSKEAAEKFKSLLSGDVDRSKELADREDRRTQNAVDRIKETAQRLRESAAETLDADRKTNTARRAEMAASIQNRARGELAKANTLSKIADKIASGEVRHLAGIKAGTHVDELDRVLRRGKWDRIQKTMKDAPWDEKEAADAAAPSAEDVDHVEYPYPKLRASDLRKNARAISDTPGLKNIAARLLKTAAKDEPKFKTAGNGFKFNNGKFLSSEKLKEEGVNLYGMTEGKVIRVHASYDFRLGQKSEAQGGSRHGPFYTADAGKSFSNSENGAVVAALNRGHRLDLVERNPEDRLLSITDPREIEDLRTAGRRLKYSKNRDLQRIGESLRDTAEQYSRLQQMDIKSPSELRAALREYLPIRSQKENEDPIKAMERKLIGTKIPDFFPTPKPLVSRMLDAADIRPGMKVLEPSAGKGDILDAIKEREPEAETEGVEPMASLREILEAKGHKLAGEDFMQHAGQYDRIVMNPPFSGGQDAEHVRKAYSHLKPGGRLVAVVSSGLFHRQAKKDQAFREWFDKAGGVVEDLPEGSFMGDDAFRQTGVNTKMLIVDKPEMPENASGVFSAVDAAFDFSLKTIGRLLTTAG